MNRSISVYLRKKSLPSLWTLTTLTLGKVAFDRSLFSLRDVGMLTSRDTCMNRYDKYCHIDVFALSDFGQFNLQNMQPTLQEFYVNICKYTRVHYMFRQ